MVVITDTDEAQQLFAVGDGDCADTGLLLNDLREMRTVLFVEAPHQDADRALGNAQCLGGKGDRVFFPHLPPVKNQAHEQGRAD